MLPGYHLSLFSVTVSINACALFAPGYAGAVRLVHNLPLVNNDHR